MNSRLFSTSIFFLAFASVARCDVSLPSLFSDRMVLQQGAPIPIWGWAEPGEAVTVRLGSQTRVAQPTANGKWRVTFAPMKASDKPVTFSVTGRNEIKINDAVVGEVWICSGQSNMAWSVRGSANAEEFAKSATDSAIRMFTVEPKAAETPQPNCKGGWAACNPESVLEFSAVGYHFARNLRAELKVPIGMINTSYGGTPVESWMPDSVFAGQAEFAALLARRKDPQVQGPWKPSWLWNAMIAPLVPYRIKGAIWYQGESNVGRAEEYRTLFPAMIQSWRSSWVQGSFPFYFVQIAPYKYGNPEARNAAALRQSQLYAMQTLPFTGMAVVTDIATVGDIHPPNKHEVGRRLALWALALDYERKVGHWSGPVPLYASRDGAKANVTFQHADGLSTRDHKAPSHLEIAGPDGQFVPAQGKIQGNTLIVWAESVSQPKQVRYGYWDDAEPNLINAAGLPASPFWVAVDR